MSGHEDEDPAAVVIKCPKCLNTSFIVKGLTMLINRICYHRICNKCVDIIFGNMGFNPCPIPGCGKRLRKQNYHKPTFEDIKMDEEVDIRKRMAIDFNKSQNDFKHLIDYNNYLNVVEDMTYNLINGIDIEQTEKTIAELKKELGKTSKGGAYSQRQKQSDKALVAALSQTLEQKSKKEKSHIAAGSDSATTLSQDGEKALEDAVGKSSTLMIRGLKQTSEDHVTVYDPFGDMRDVKDYVGIPTQTNLWNDYLGKIRQEMIYRAGGYSLDEFYSRALNETFGGLGLSVKEEIAQNRKKKIEKNDSDVNMADVF